MSPLGWRGELVYRLQHTTIPVHQGTAYASVAGELHEMAGSYMQDGDHFLSKNDPVNSLASWSYALGWLDAGTSLGLLETRHLDCRWLFAPMPLSASNEIFLNTKTMKYALLLSSALTSAVPAPEPDTRVYRVSERIMMVSGLFFRWGEWFTSSGRAPNALGAYSYGHAWLDAGIRAGLLRASASRDIFAV